MNQDVYPIERDGDKLVFLFTSNNHSGTNPVLKMVDYSRVIKHGKVYYNLCLSDYHEKIDYFNDMAVTDNGDMRKVLRTVISTLGVFLMKTPGKVFTSTEVMHDVEHTTIKSFVTTSRLSQGCTTSMALLNHSENK